MRCVVEKWICELLCSRLVSVLWASLDNRIKQTAQRALSPESWMYECRVISFECSVLITDCCNRFHCSVNKLCYLLKSWAYLLQYIMIYSKMHFLIVAANQMQEESISYLSCILLCLNTHILLVSVPSPDLFPSAYLPSTAVSTSSFS